MLRKLRLLLLPFSILYGLIVRIRHFLYDYHIKKSTSFYVPLICVGNISVGGTGKSPMVEFLIRKLQKKYKIGVLSRGYKRKTKGFVLADETTSVHDLGDEPYQFHVKFPEVTIAVDNNRVAGVKQLQLLGKMPDVLILDDAYQHRRIQAGFSVVLTTYQYLYCNDWLLPAGNLRDLPSRANKADVIIVTKCPSNLSLEEQIEIREKLNIKSYQELFFAKIAYSPNIFNGKEEFSLQNFIKEEFALVTGIANPKPLINYLKSLNANFTHINFADHHNFSDKELLQLQKQSRILTTEKDFVRLENQLTNLYYLPIQMEFLSEKQQSDFLKLLQKPLISKKFK